MEGSKGVAVEQAVVVRDVDGDDMYRLRAADGQVAVEVIPLRFGGPPKVPLANLREAVNALHALGGDA